MKNTSLRKNLSLLIPVGMLLILSLLDMYGASFTSGLYSKLLGRQTVWIIVGLLAMFLVYHLNMNFLLKFSGLFYILGVLSLVLVLFFGKNVNGARSWFQVGPISFQPSELFKFFYLMYLSKVIEDSSKPDFKLFLKILALSFVPCLLIFLEPDTGVVVMYLLMMFGLLWASGVDKKYPLILITSGLVVLVVFFGLYFTNGDVFTEIFGVSFFYRMDRLLTFKNLTSYQLSNALIAIGTSGITGFGLTHKKMYIPEAPTDFVFDLTICNFGLIAGILVVLVYVFLLRYLQKNLSTSTHKMGKCILSGTLFMMTFQTFEHIFMNLGLTPITGITLPFLSYGGSSLISYFLIFGLILKITTNSSSYN